MVYIYNSVINGFLYCTFELILVDRLIVKFKMSNCPSTVEQGFWLSS